MDSGPLHSVKIQIPADVPDMIPLDGRGDLAIQDAILINLAPGVVPGMKRICYLPALMDNDVIPQ